jgi:hypothetical protein
VEINDKLEQFVWRKSRPPHPRFLLNEVVKTGLRIPFTFLHRLSGASTSLAPVIGADLGVFELISQRHRHDVVVVIVFVAVRCTPVAACPGTVPTYDVYDK